MNDEMRRTLGQRVEAARVAKRWSKEQAAREAQVSSITLKRIEDGFAVQDTKLHAVLEALGIRDTAMPAGQPGPLEDYDDTDLLAELLSRATRRRHEEGTVSAAEDDQPVTITTIHARRGRHGSASSNRVDVESAAMHGEGSEDANDSGGDAPQKRTRAARTRRTPRPPENHA